MPQRPTTPTRYGPFAAHGVNSTSNSSHSRPSACACARSAPRAQRTSPAGIAPPSAATRRVRASSRSGCGIDARTSSLDAAQDPDHRGGIQRRRVLRVALDDLVAQRAQQLGDLADVALLLAPQERQRARHRLRRHRDPQPAAAPASAASANALDPPSTVASRNSAASATRRAIGPLTLSPCHASSCGATGTRPRVGFSPNSPVHADGLRIDPAPSDPSATPARPAAIAGGAAARWTRPASASGPTGCAPSRTSWCRSPAASSAPAPASCRRSPRPRPAAAGPPPRRARPAPACAAVPHAVASPATSTSSLIATGTPSSGRESCPAPRARVGLRGLGQRQLAPAPRGTRSACGFDAAIRASVASTTSRDDTSPARDEAGLLGGAGEGEGGGVHGVAHAIGPDLATRPAGVKEFRVDGQRRADGAVGADRGADRAGDHHPLRALGRRHARGRRDGLLRRAVALVGRRPRGLLGARSGSSSRSAPRTPYTRVLGSRAMPGAEWFPGARLNYAEHVFAGKTDSALALQHASEVREQDWMTWGELRDLTARIYTGLEASWRRNPATASSPTSPTSRRRSRRSWPAPRWARRGRRARRTSARARSSTASRRSSRRS